MEEEWLRSEEALRKLHVSHSTTSRRDFTTNEPPTKEKPPSIQTSYTPTPITPSSSHVGLIYEEKPPSPIQYANEMPIDAALSDTLQNPQERMNLLKFENKILHFVKSKESVLNVPPMTNSFHRLLVYRIAQRFQLEHTFMDYSQPDAAEKGFALVKSSMTRIPTPLLIDIPLKEEVSNVKSASAVPIIGNNEKPVLMKRDTKKSKHKERKKTDSNKEASTDREKAYAEARARIFGLEGKPDTTEASIKSSPLTSAPTASAYTPVSVNKVAPVVIDTADKKVTIRDRVAEMFDPDFVRQGSQPPIHASGYLSNGASYDNQYDHQHMQYQQQQPNGYSHGYHMNSPYSTPSMDSSHSYGYPHNSNSNNGYHQSYEQGSYDQYRGGGYSSHNNNRNSYPSPPLPPMHSLSSHVGYPHGSASYSRNVEQGGYSNHISQQAPPRDGNAPVYTLEDFPKLS